MTEPTAEYLIAQDQAAINRQQAALVAELKARIADICRGVETDAVVEALETVTQWVESGGLEVK